MTDHTTIAMRFAESLENRLRTLAGNDEDSGVGHMAEAPFVPPTPIFHIEADAAPAVREPLSAIAEYLAAVSGRFRPDDLFPEQSNEENRQVALSRLEPFCIIETQEGNVRWLLTQKARKPILTQLQRNGRLSQLLKQPLPPTDLLGEWLRELLRKGSDVRFQKRKRDDLLALSLAIEVIADVGFPHPDPADVRRLLTRSRFLEEYDLLLANGFYGRRKELQALQQFLNQSGSDSNTSQWTGLVLTGIGGAGKSTLLAKFARDAAATRKATIVILDFDRPGIDPNDLYWLEKEMSRQVGQQYPETEEMLRTGREQARNQKRDLGQISQYSGADAASVGRSLRHTLSNIITALQQVQMDGCPLLLILDTFEEVTQRDLDSVIFDWLDEITELLWPVSLKVIFSGRLFQNSLDILKSRGGLTQIDVGELELRLAERLLLNLGVPEVAAKRLARSDVLPRRPLELKLLARLITDQSSSIDELENELQRDVGASTELFAGVIYRRVLLRLKNEVARSLAYPGLLLRYLTADLIQKVLVPALNLQPFDNGEAEQALSTLASYTWLAYRGPNGEVWHRKDLRRSMLKLMVANEHETAERINKLAIDFFAQGNEKEQSEAVYHQLMLVKRPEDGESLELDHLRNASGSIGADIQDLPPIAATLLRFAMDGNVPASDFELLPHRYLAGGYVKTGRRLINSREFGGALRLLHRGIEGGVAFQPVMDQWETQTLFATASWDELIAYDHFPTHHIRDGSIKGLFEYLYPAEIIVSERVNPERSKIC